MSVLKTREEMDASHRIAYDLGRESAEARIKELEREVEDAYDRGYENGLYAGEGYGYADGYAAGREDCAEL